MLHKKHPAYTNEYDGCNGAFNLVFINKNKRKIKLFVIASNGFDWEHVSISIKDKKRCPTWDEMCFVKSVFWDKQDMVIQYHPAEEDYISFHDYCLHLWRPINQIIPAPDYILVAPKGLKT